MQPHPMLNDCEIQWRDLSIKQHQLLNVNIIGKTFPTPEYGSYGQVLPHYLFEYILSGEGNIYYKNKILKLSAGDCCVIQKGIRCSYNADKHNPYQKLYFCVHGEYIQNLCDLFKISQPITIKKADVSAYFSRIIDAAQHDTCTQELYMHEILNILIKLSPIDINSTIYTQSSDIAASARQYIEKNALNDISINEIANYVKTSRRTFLRQYTNTYNETPYRTITRFRLLASLDLLSSTSKSITEIAELVNIVPTSHFTQKFKEFYGLTPSQHRKNSRKK